MIIGIIDYGMGNILSVKNAIEYLGYNAEIVDNPNLISKYDKLVLPGVGAFKVCIDNLYKTNFVKALNQQVLIEKKPILGICLGMQVMAKEGSEGGKFNGLGWFDAKVVKIIPNDKKIKVPNIGWNSICFEGSNKLFYGLPDLTEVYFVHSYHVECVNKMDVIATSNHGQTITAAINRENIYGTQFHPEKSQDLGLMILENFLKI